MKQIFSIVTLLAVNLAFFGVNGDTSIDRAAALWAASEAAVAKFQKDVDEGVYLPIPNNSSLTTPLVSLPGGLTLTAGLVTLPLDFLCRQEDTSIIKTVTCYVCSNDCIYVHNKYAGQCGDAKNPIPGTPQTAGPVCVCNESPPAKGVDVTDVETQCGSLVDPLIVDVAVNLAFAKALRARMLAAQCLGSPLLGKVDSVGCNVDCTTNHDYASGTCGEINPIATLPLDLHPTFGCPCSH